MVNIVFHFYKDHYIILHSVFVTYHVQMMHVQRKPGRPRTTWKDIIQCDLDSLMTGWSLEEAEVAVRDRKIWGLFLCQAVHVGACIHDAI